MAGMEHRDEVTAGRQVKSMFSPRKGHGNPGWELLINGGFHGEGDFESSTHYVDKSNSHSPCHRRIRIYSK